MTPHQEFISRNRFATQRVLYLSGGSLMNGNEETRKIESRFDAAEIMLGR